MAKNEKNAFAAISGRNLIIRMREGCFDTHCNESASSGDRKGADARTDNGANARA
jgi:hypothetical protein